MKIGIIDADLIGRKKHRFPNLASMKISAYNKSIGNEVKLLLDYKSISDYDKVYISKVFTDTEINKEILELDNVEYGGSGFFYDKAPNLPYEIEHIKPDYKLYEEFILDLIEKGYDRKEFKYYLDYSIGFTTRGCFRKCSFCINQNYDKVYKHSDVNEFIDGNRKYICLLDDNILGYSNWKEVFNELNSTNKRFEFKQGMDERTLNKDKIQTILNSNTIGDLIFAFDNIKDKDIIEKKLELWRTIDDKKTLKFYVLCAYESQDVNDIVNTFERIKILMKYNCVPYIMRYKEYNNSELKGIYITLARWCNQPSFFKKKSFREFCEANGSNSASMRYLKEFESKYKEVANKYFDLKYEEV